MVQLTHNLQLSVLGGKGREPQKTVNSPCLPSPQHYSPIPAEKAKQLFPCVPAPRPPGAAPNSSPPTHSPHTQAGGLWAELRPLIHAFCNLLFLLRFRNQMAPRINLSFLASLEKSYDTATRGPPPWWHKPQQTGIGHPVHAHPHCFFWMHLGPWTLVWMLDAELQIPGFQCSSSQRGSGLSLFPEDPVSASIHTLLPSRASELLVIRFRSLLGLNCNQILTCALELLVPLKVFNVLRPRP